MKKLYDFTCTNQECKKVFEDLVDTEETPPVCPICKSASEQNKLSHCPTVEANPHWSEVFMKGRNIRNKITGKVPWRKNSESQTISNCSDIDSTGESNALFIHDNKWEKW